MSKTLLILSISILILLAGSGAGVSALAASGAMTPENIFFPVQEWAENARAGLTANPGDRLDYALVLLERRTQDLARLANHPWGQGAAVGALDRALNRAVLALAALSPQQRLVSDRAVLFRLALITDTLDLMRQMAPGTSAEFESFAAKAAALRSLMQNGPPTSESLLELSRWVLSAPAPRGNFSLDMLRQGAAGGFTHAMFPLSAPHTMLTCVQCHNPDQPKASAACQTCHSDQKPAAHFSADCSACHFTAGWTPARMNHALSGSDCQSCHANRAPQGHFPGQCAQCHSTPSLSGGVTAGLTGNGGAWRVITWNHALGQSLDCQACHANRRPANHFNGQCSQCHTAPGGGTISGFKPATFTHTTATDCATCHAGLKPANHYQGQCADCHTAPVGGVSVGWKGGTFTHTTAADCATCHAGRKPANHYQGQCSALPQGARRGDGFHRLERRDLYPYRRRGLRHLPRRTQAGQSLPGAVRGLPQRACRGNGFVGWKGATFNHAVAGATNCATCHADRKPANHYQGQCSACHKAPVAGTASVGWRGATFNHAAAGATNCATCHAGTKPANHYTGAVLGLPHQHRPGARPTSTMPRPGPPTAPAATPAQTGQPLHGAVLEPATHHGLAPGQLQPCRGRGHQLHQLPRRHQTGQPLHGAVLAMPQHQRLAPGQLQPRRGRGHGLPGLPRQPAPGQPFQRAVLAVPYHLGLEAGHVQAHLPAKSQWGQLALRQVPSQRAAGLHLLWLPQPDRAAKEAR